MKKINFSNVIINLKKKSYVVVCSSAFRKASSVGVLGHEDLHPLGVVNVLLPLPDVVGRRLAGVSDVYEISIFKKKVHVHCCKNKFWVIFSVEHKQNLKVFFF